MLSLVKMLLKREVCGRELNSRGNYIVDPGKSWKNHGIVFFNFCGSPDISTVAQNLTHHLNKARNTLLVVFSFTLNHHLVYPVFNINF